MFGSITVAGAFAEATRTAGRHDARQAKTTKTARPVAGTAARAGMLAAWLGRLAAPMAKRQWS